MYVCIYDIQVKGKRAVNLLWINTLQHHCNTLQHTATHCNTLQSTVDLKLIEDPMKTNIKELICANSAATHCNIFYI